MELLNKINWNRVLSHAIFIAVGFLFAFALLGVIGPVSFAGDAPAWVQAVGSVLGIAIAIAVPWAQHQLALARDRAAAELKARSLALDSLLFFRDYLLATGQVLDIAKREPRPITIERWKYLESLIDVGGLSQSVRTHSDGFGIATADVQSFLYHYLMASISAGNAVRTRGDEDHREAFLSHLERADKSILATVWKVEAIAAAGAENPYRQKAVEPTHG